MHPTAIIDEGATIGAGTKIWHFCHIMGGAVIGERCSFGQNVFVGSRARVGNNVKVQNNVPIYDCVEIEDDVFCGPCMVFTNVMNPRSGVSRKDEYMTTRVRHGATIGASATIICGSTLGEYCFIGAGAVVKGDIPPYALVVGVPGRIIGWMSQHGERLDFGSGDEAVCPGTGQRYRRIAENRIELVKS
ncbi:MAG: N-acetyltransferase [Phycisphaerae bacterium]|nr:N-acetyltransferase [Phycisphaerae bacterium]